MQYLGVKLFYISIIFSFNWRVVPTGTVCVILFSFHAITYLLATKPELLAGRGNIGILCSSNHVFTNGKWHHLATMKSFGCLVEMVLKPQTIAQAGNLPSRFKQFYIISNRDLKSTLIAPNSKFAISCLPFFHFF